MLAVAAYAVEMALWRTATRQRELTRLARESFALVTDRESALRGYLLTGEDTLLGPERAARPLIRPKLDSLLALTRDPRQRERAAELARAIERWDREFAQPVLAATGRAASDFHATLLDKPLFDPIRRIVAEFLTAEYALYAASRRRVEVLATVHLIVLLVSLGVAATMLPRLRSSLIAQTSDLESLFEELYEMNERLLATAKEREAAGKEVRKLNEDLARRLDELTRANAELEAFSYSISHDLRTPLRSFDGYSQILLEDYGDRLDETARQYLQRMRANSHRMAQLIDDLLDLSRVSRGELSRERVDLTAVAHEILGDLTRANPERDVRVSVAHGLTATGDPRLLRLVMQNLLDNAWKFTAGTEGAEIAVDARAEGEGGGRAYFVRDTGVGFDMAFADKLFGPFQRLHGAEFPGSGVGLAIVKRIIERHGGRVWAEASPGRGATFYFTVPTPATS